MNIEELARLAEGVVALEASGVVRTMTEAERLRFRESFPNVEMIFGDFVVLKVEEHQKMRKA